MNLQQLYELTQLYSLRYHPQAMAAGCGGALALRKATQRRLAAASFAREYFHRVEDAVDAGVLAVYLAPGESAIQCPSALNVLKDTYDHSCC